MEAAAEPFIPTVDTVIACFVCGHVRAMLRSKVVESACRLGIEPEADLIGKVAGDLIGEVAPALINHRPDLVHNSGLPIVEVIDNHVQFYDMHRT